MEKIIGFLTCLLCLSSCQSPQIKQFDSSELLLSNESSIDSLKFPQAITADQASRDINFLIYVLSNAYSGKKHISQETINAAVKAINAITLSQTEVADFHDKIDTALFMIPDNHLQAYFKGQVSKIRQRYEANSQGKVGKNKIFNPQDVWEVQLEKIGNKKILYISLIKFPSYEDKIWQNFISSVSLNMQNSDSIIIDLRGNTGGDDTIGLELAGILYGHPFQHPIKRQYRTQTPEALALWANRFNIEMINRKADHQEIPSYLVNDFNESKNKYENAIEGKIPSEIIRTNKGLDKGSFDFGPGYKKPIYVLMDRVCGSSCEFTIAALEKHTKLKKIGENSSGTFHFSNAGIAVLPHSKIKIMIPSQYNEYYDNRFIERIGFTPDIKVPEGKDAYFFLQKLIDKK